MKTTLNSFAFGAVGLAAGLLLCGCDTSPKTTRGAGVGAATGALIGGIIGHQSGETGAGAAIGAAVGGVAGGAYGNRQDNQEASRTDGFQSDNQFLYSQLTADEVSILRARAAQSGRSNAELTDFLTSAEKENLRRRASQQREIGR